MDPGGRDGRIDGRERAALGLGEAMTRIGDAARLDEAIGRRLQNSSATRSW
jgi:hypothetical protein